MKDITYPMYEDIIAIHDEVVANDEETEAGLRSPGSIETVLVRISEGFYGQVPKTIHEKAALLIRLLGAEQIFVDGEKRTALYTTVLFYTLNGYEFDYDETVYDLLQRLATDESAVDRTELIEYMRTHTTNK